MIIKVPRASRRRSHAGREPKGEWPTTSRSRRGRAYLELGGASSANGIPLKLDEANAVNIIRGNDHQECVCAWFDNVDWGGRFDSEKSWR